MIKVGIHWGRVQWLMHQSYLFSHRFRRFEGNKKLLATICSDGLVWMVRFQPKDVLLFCCHGLMMRYFYLLYRLPGLSVP